MEEKLISCDTYFFFRFVFLRIFEYDFIFAQLSAKFDQIALPCCGLSNAEFKSKTEFWEETAYLAYTYIYSDSCVGFTFIWIGNQKYDGKKMNYSKVTTSTTNYRLQMERLMWISVHTFYVVIPKNVLHVPQSMKRIFILCVYFVPCVILIVTIIAMLMLTLSHDDDVGPLEK